MNGIDKIIARMEADTQAECADIAAQAAAEAEAILARYRAEADKLLREGEARCKVLEHEQVERLEGGSRLACRQRVLAEKQRMLDEAFARAADALLKLPRPEYIDLLASLAAENGRGAGVLRRRPGHGGSGGGGRRQRQKARRGLHPGCRHPGDGRRRGTAAGPHGDQLRLCRAAAPGTAGGLLRRGRRAV